MRSLTLKADPVGDSVPQNPRVMVVGAGEKTYLWIGNDAGFVGIARNTPELRDFLRKALARLGRARKGARRRAK